MRALLLLRGAMFCYVGEWVVRSLGGGVEAGRIGCCEADVS